MITLSIFCSLLAFKWALNQLPKSLSFSSIQNYCCHISAEVYVRLFSLSDTTWDYTYFHSLSSTVRQIQSLNLHIGHSHWAQTPGFWPIYVCNSIAGASAEVTTCSRSSFFKMFSKIFSKYFSRSLFFILKAVDELKWKKLDCYQEH